MRALLALTLLVYITQVESRGQGVYSNSYVFLEARNGRGERFKTCANYLQYTTQRIADTLKSAKPIGFSWWGGERDNYNVCEKGAGVSLDGQSSAVNYRLESGDGDCAEPFVDPAKPQQFKYASNFEVQELKKSGAGAAILLLNKGQRYVHKWRDFLFSEFTDPFINKSTAIPTYFLYKEDMNKIAALGDGGDMSGVELRFHRPASSRLDLSMLIIWLLAVGSVAGGGLWAFHRENHGKDLRPLNMNSSAEELNENVKEGKNTNESEVEPVPGDLLSNENSSVRTAVEIEGKLGKFCNKYGNWIAIITLMSVLITVLMLGYFFRDILVTLFNVLCMVMGSFAVHGCVNALLSNLPLPSVLTTPVAKTAICCFQKNSTSPRSMAVYAASLTFCVWWFIVRNDTYAFVMLDFINFCMCLHILKSLRLPSVKWIAVLMVCMFVYDAFMVFGTPYLTPNSCSVMLQVATGMDCNSNPNGFPTPPIDADLPEKFPMLMQVMHFDPMLECIDVEIEKGYQRTILGLGDIIIPGYLTTHCFTMSGFAPRLRLFYGGVALVGYGVGLVATFAALTLMGLAQPALIYLVPFTLIPIVSIAACRGHLQAMWRGVPEASDVSVPKNDVDSSSTSYEQVAV